MKQCTKCGVMKEEEYFGLTTKNGKQYLKSWCKPCSNEYNSAYRKANPDVVKKAGRKWLDNNPDYHRRRQIEQYGITVEQYQTMHDEQNGVCAICGLPEVLKGKNLAVDHDHATGQVRALLCFNCNTALGGFKDDATLLIKAAGYLNEYRTPIQ